MKGAKLILVVLLSCSLVGCANIKDDSTRTKTEGTLVGAGAGAALGALIGGIAGGGRGALIGAGIGLGAGALGGFLVGKHVADKKAEYVSEEEWLDACIDHAHKVNAETKRYNARLAKDIAKLDRESATLQAQYRNKAATKSSLHAELKRTKQMQQETKKTLDLLEKDRSKQAQAAQEARRMGKTKKAAAMDREIKTLEAQIKKMREYNSKLANISVRLAV